MRIIFIILIVLVGKAEAQTSALAISDSLYALGNYEEAILELKSFEPKTEAVFVRLAKANEASGDWDTALEYYHKILVQNPNRVLTAINYGELLQKVGDIKAADSLFTNLSIAYPKNASFQYRLGEIKESKGDSISIELFRKAITLDATHQQALFKVAKYELAHSNYPLAKKFAKMGLEKNPKNVSLLSILAQTYYNQQYYRAAMEQFEKIVALGKGNEFVYNKLGMCYYRSFQYEEAIENFKECLKFEDRNSETHYNLGKLYAIIGDFQKSEIELLMAILIKKQPVDAEFLSLALTYKGLEDYKNMLKYTEAALEENPDNERALYEKAIAADNYFKDITSKIQYYQNYVNSYSKNGNPSLIELAQSRISDLKKEQHLQAENQ